MKAFTQLLARNGACVEAKPSAHVALVGTRVVEFSRWRVAGSNELSIPLTPCGYRFMWLRR